MRYFYTLLVFALVSFDTNAQSRMNIIPAPENVVEKPGSFLMNPQVKIYADASFKEVATLLSPTIILTKPSEKKSTNFILIEKTNDKTSDSGAYSIVITTKNIHVRSNHVAGAINGITTLTQLLLTQEVYGSIPCGEISDKPRFGYRGMMLDVSRNFYPPPFIIKMLDLLSIYKMNTLHLHLTDAAGWRIQIDKYPALTKHAAWRTKKTWKEWWITSKEYATEGDANAFGGYYTKQEAKQMVDYAKLRGITIIPEIEMPGHSEEVIAAYPQLGCDGVKGLQGEFCIGNDSTFTFMEDVVSEIMEIFPSEFIHVGGDEASKINWKSCAKCQKRIKDNQLKDEFELQSYAIKRMEKFISSKGRKLLGWDEILEGGLAPGARVMSWRGEAGGVEAAKMGHDVVMTPGSFCYFDKYQQEPSTQPEAIGGFLPLQKVYQYDPYPAALEKDKQEYVKGAQANVWTEYIPTAEHLEYMIFPRIMALSEAVWSDPEKRNWSDFQARLSHHYRMLQKLNVNYCRPSDRVEIANNIDVASKTTSITLSSEQYLPDIRYTVDGSTPSISSNKYVAPFNVSGTSIIKASIFRNGKTTKIPDTLKIDFHKAIGKNVVYNKPYNNSYPAQKNETLVNGYTGSLTYQDGQWQGFTNNMDVTIDLGKEEKISTLKSTFMQVIGPGVYMPDYVEVSISTDGKNFTLVGKDMNNVSTTDPSLIFKTFRVDFVPTTARYIRFFAKNHTGFLFADELIID